LVVAGSILGFLTLGLGWVVLLPLAGAVPLAAAIYGTIAAIQAHEGRDFRYWLIGDWVQPD